MKFVDMFQILQIQKPFNLKSTVKMYYFTVRIRILATNTFCTIIRSICRWSTHREYAICLIKSTKQQILLTRKKNKRSISAIQTVYLDQMKHISPVYVLQSRQGHCLGTKDLINFLLFFNELQYLIASGTCSHIPGAKFVTEFRPWYFSSHKFAHFRT